MGDAHPAADDAWEAAYVRFQTPEQEVRKFVRRLRALGARRWSSDARILDLFCGRGGGMAALTNFGFGRVCGIDLSPRLLRLHQGASDRVAGDCRALPFARASFDIAIVQGGLHHLAALPADLERVLEEVERVLEPGGLFVAVEPWRTPFLDLVHAVAGRRPAQYASRKLDALATMIELEGDVYRRWLDAPEAISALLTARFEPELRETRWGKLLFAGRTRRSARPA
ncbi:MAG: class I SAM-dependent methyltransferase, partial [Vicinamibacterales bacterium]